MVSCEAVLKTAACFYSVFTAIEAHTHTDIQTYCVTEPQRTVLNSLRSDAPEPFYKHGNIQSYSASLTFTVLLING